MQQEWNDLKLFIYGQAGDKLINDKTVTMNLE